MPSKYLYVKNCIARRRRWLDGMKQRPCERCGVQYESYVMEFHHRDPSNKIFAVSRDSFRRGRKAVLEEIAKCDLLCANCHRIVEHSDQSARMKRRVMARTSMIDDLQFSLQLD